MKQAALSSASAKVFSPAPTTRVLHVIKSLGRGGAEKLLVETLKQHDHRRFEMRFVYFLPWKNQLVDELEFNNGRVTCIPARTSFGIIMAFFKLIRFIRRNEIDIIHAHMPVAGIVARLAGMITKTPVVYTEHNTWERYHKLTRFFNKITYPFQSKVIAVSAEVGLSIKKNYRRSKPDVQVVRNGVNTKLYSRVELPGRDIRKEFSISPEAVVIGVTCVFRAQKRLESWLEVASQLHQTFHDVRFIIVGDGVLREQVFKKAKELNTSSFVFFPGLQVDIKPYLEAMDIYMMTSEFEGLPVALLEAMSMNCVPACTSAGGIGEIIHDGVNGIVVPVDAPDLLYGRLCNLLLDQASLSRMKEDARNTVVNKFGIDRMVIKIEEIYDSLLNKVSVS